IIGALSQRVPFNLFFGRLWKILRVNENCVGCGLCERNCPVGAVKLEGDKPTFSRDCILCLRCYNFCPENAILITKKSSDTEKYRRYRGPEGFKVSLLKEDPSVH
ncbi:MAG: EFR1 family ferrodoxin, partial [Promethearchaeota archaeon]